MKTQTCIAMILAGGRGSRLKELTDGLAKPAVPFGGKYRIIDFPLSNCVNSGINTVGVLTQYQPLALHSYIGIGSAWDLDQRGGGLTLLPPYSSSSEVKWYSGTASAVYQNVPYIEQHNPEHVLILSGDHIYKMDYEKLLDHHINKKADVTISVIEVPWEEAGRFGIMNIDADCEVMSFEEKPDAPKSNLASMGVYIFKWSVLKKYLELDESNPDSSNDFGKNVIPAMLEDNQKLCAYPFEGYWKDVGTVKSLWEANMDLLQQDGNLDLFDSSWRVYTGHANLPPQVVGPDASVQNVILTEGCTVYGKVSQSVVSQGTDIEEGALVDQCVIMPNARIGRNAVVKRAIIAENVQVPANAVINNLSEDILLVTEEYLVSAAKQLVGS